MTQATNLASLTNKIQAFALLVTALVWTYPHAALGAQKQDSSKLKPLVFDIKQKEELQRTFGKTLKESPHSKLTASLKSYLTAKKSPLANCTETILAQKNWKKILSLANAESGLGKRFPESTNNLWGVGGSNLWVMGDTMCEAIPTMNEFLANNPRRSAVKYQDMPIERMNGVYKQPAANHWVVNNNVILRDLSELERKAFERTNTEITSDILAKK